MKDFRAAGALAACVVGLWGCCHNYIENPIIAQKCTFVHDLLAKNFKQASSANVSVLGNGGGFSEAYEVSGPMLSGESAFRMSQMDAVCRAWALGTISDEKYADVLLTYVTGSIVEPGGVDTSTVVAESRRVLAQQEVAGNLPNAGLASRLEAKVMATDPMQAKSDMNAAWVSAAQGHRVLAGQGAFESEVLGRLSYLESSMRRIAPAEEIGKPELIYFTTGSASLTYGELSKLKARAAAWTKAGRAVSVQGYTDQRGKPRANAALSWDRAKAVRDVLIRHGVKIDSVEGVGIAADTTDQYGEDRVVVVTPLLALSARGRTGTLNGI